MVSKDTSSQIDSHCCSNALTAMAVWQEHVIQGMAYTGCTLGRHWGGPGLSTESVAAQRLHWKPSLEMLRADKTSAVCAQPDSEYSVQSLLPTSVCVDAASVSYGWWYSPRVHCLHKTPVIGTQICVTKSISWTEQAPALTASEQEKKKITTNTLLLNKLTISTSTCACLWRKSHSTSKVSSLPLFYKEKYSET